MKPTRVALAIAAATMIATPVFATNGDNLIGLGAQSRALGGTGTAAFYGSENALTNPSLLGKAQGSEFAIGGTLFMPDVKAESDVAGIPTSATSDADTNVIPEVSMYRRINNNWTFGMGMYGTAGMGVDYRDEPALFSATTNLQLMKFVPAFAYNNDNYGFGFAPVIQYGALDINYSGTPGFNGTGVSDDLGFGVNLGAHFDVNPALTVAVAYQSAIDMEYDDQLTDAADGFGLGPCAQCTQTITSDKLEQPAEIKLGVAYDMNNRWMLTADAKQIQWGSANGYEDFNWDDQMVYALGAKYTGNGFWAGFGYNFGEDPIDVLENDPTNPMTTYANQGINLFNNHFFPAITEDHVTVGGGYSLSKTTTLEGAFVYALEVDKTIDTGSISDAFDDGVPNGSVPADGTSHTVEHSQTGITVSLRMNF
ncbi:OmpP1/FadL family transporter [Thiohalomonas denitrificans]|nr:outer membrane protein transport protein [Thiohalomonas denitrificans]